jgi:nitrogen fixation protein NifU and related proteins
MADLRESPRNFHALEKPTVKAEGYNPLCGDRCTVYVALEGDVIEDIGFQGSGCAISRASASMMTQSLKGKTVNEAEDLFHRFVGLATGQDGNGTHAEFGKLAVFGGVAEFPARVKCATLAWHTLQAALHGDREPVTTE